MTEYLFPIAFLLVIYALIIGFLAKIYSRNRNWQPSLFRLISIRKSIIEQKLVLEALSASSREEELGAIIKSIGTYAAGLLGYDKWIVWLRKDRDRFYVADFQVGEEIENPASLFNSYDPGLYYWVKSNSISMLITGKIRELAKSREMNQALDSLRNGIIIPLIEADRLHGFIAVGGKKKAIKRSEQFLSLFGAASAILIRKSILDSRERDSRRKQQQAESMAALGKLAAGLAHEIKNPLTFIRSTSEHLKDQYQLPEEDQELAEGVLEEIDRINKRVEEMLTLARIDVQSFTPVNIGNILLRNIMMAEKIARQVNIEIKQMIALEDVAILGDEDKLTQLFQNMIVNAIQAIERDGILEIKALENKGFIEIYIRDTGPGIPEEIRQNVFQPFFTTKERGTGLGLSICYSIATAHGGSLEVLKTDKKGTTFLIILPASGRENGIQ